ncbi:MAG: hypothetical protein Q7S40_00670 [Opitutaceae bacterium]|nr:hypothetical protein [Opitutaceae bacterium]
MPVSPRNKTPLGAIAAPGLVIAGFLIGIAAWMLPVNLKSLSPALLQAAGSGTPTLGAYGRDLVDVEKIGAAGLVLGAARSSGDPRAPALQQALDQFAARQPGIVAWGGWDPFLDPLFNLRSAAGKGVSTPVVTFMITEKARTTLRNYLANSGSQAVQAFLQLRELTATGRFVPATRPGGQSLETMILLTGLLYQGGHLSASLQRELRALADTAVKQKALGDLETFFIDLLSLGRRLDWGQLAELLRRTDSTKTMSEYSHLARVAPDQLPLIYAAALFSDSADRVAVYLIEFGKQGLEDLKLALSHGQGAVRQLLLRQVPVNRTATPVLSTGAEVALTHPELMLAIKYLGYFLGVFLVLRGLDRWLVSPAGLAAVPSALVHMKAGVLALVFAMLLIAVTEPFLLKAAPLSEYRPRVHLALDISNSTVAPQSQPVTTMDSSTLLSIGIFAALQIAMYFACLLKIREVARQAVSPLVKLRLMENEENLFDGGLYVGIGGTAAALVLQVLGVIEPNLLAAYSSNLFGITCVALVKIRHVRPYKRQLILEGQVGADPVREANEPSVRSARGAAAL